VWVCNQQLECNLWYLGMVRFAEEVDCFRPNNFQSLCEEALRMPISSAVLYFTWFFLNKHIICRNDTMCVWPCVTMCLWGGKCVIDGLK